MQAVAPEASPVGPVQASRLMAVSWASFFRACALPLAQSTARIDWSVEAVYTRSPVVENRAARQLVACACSSAGQRGSGEGVPLGRRAGCGS